MNADFQTLESNSVFKNQWMELYQDKVKAPSGRTMSYTWYRSSDVVVIAPFIDDNTMVMINQFRYPLKKKLLEFPAGHVEEGEKPAETAARELKEETGFEAGNIEYIYRYHPSVSRSAQAVHVFKATNLTSGTPRQDSTEDIEIVTVTVKELQKLILEKRVDNAATLICYLLCCKM